MLRIREEQFVQMAENLHMAVEDLIVPVKEASLPVLPRGAGLHIREEQDCAMAADMRERFISKTVLLLKEGAPGWCQDKSTEEKEEFVRVMIGFARANNIRKEINIQKLIVWHFEFAYAIPLSNYLEHKLNVEDLEENARMERFYDVLKSSVSLIEISLSEEL